MSEEIDGVQTMASRRGSKRTIESKIAVGRNVSERSSAVYPERATGYSLATKAFLDRQGKNNGTAAKGGVAESEKGVRTAKMRCGLKRAPESRRVVKKISGETGEIRMKTLNSAAEKVAREGDDFFSRITDVERLYLMEMELG